MSFTFTNYAAIPPQDSMWHNALKKVMEGYTEGTKAKYLQPGLEEELKKAKLYNQYYGPDIESQIGLRGAQTKQANAHTGLLGEQTRAAHMSNANLPAKLRAELEAQQMKTQNPLLGMTGHAGQIGALMYLQQHPELMQQQQMQQQMGQQGQPNPNESQIPSAFGNQQEPPQQRQLNPMQLLHQSIMEDLLRKTAAKVTPLETAQNYAEEQSQLHGKDSEQAKLARDYVNKIAHGTEKQKDLALQQHRERTDNMAVWKSLPANAKAHAIAIGQGAGFSADETVRWLSSGKSMKDLLFQHGIKDESEIEPVYQLTGAAQSQLLQRQFASKEADYLSSFIRKSTGEYARTVAGYSTKLLKDQMEGKNEEKQAKFMAARGLAPELINLRLVLANAKSTVSAQKQLREKAMLDMGGFRSLVTPKVWTRMQEVMDSELQKMFKHAQTGFGQKISQEVEKKSNRNMENSSDMPTAEGAAAEYERRKLARGQNG